MNINIEKTNYDYIFISPFLINKDNNFFNWGAELHLKNIINLIKKNKRILVIQKSFKNKNYFSQISWIDFYFIKAKNNFIFKMKLAYFLNKFRTKHIHFNYLWLEKFIIKKKNIKYTATYHGTLWDFPVKDFDWYYVKNNFFRWFWSYLYKKLFIFEQNKSIKKLDKILSVDTSLLRYVQQFCTNSRDKIEVIYNFVDIEKFKYKGKIENKDNFFNILYPRNISYARWVHLLVPIALELKKRKLNFKFIIVWGSISEIWWNHYELKLHKQIKEYNLWEYFIFTWRVEHNIISSYFKKADLVFIPTFFSEGTSLACLEWMASWKIVLATNIWWLMDIIIDWYNWFLSSPNVKELSEKIEYIYKNQSNLDYIRKNTIDIVSNVYSKIIWDKKIINFFNNKI